MEAILPVAPARRYPIFTGGRRSAPPAGCGGPWAFLEQRQRYSPLRVIELAELLVADPNQHVGEVLGDRHEELVKLCRWMQVDRFDRRAANRQLAEGMVEHPTDSSAGIDALVEHHQVDAVASRPAGFDSAMRCSRERPSRSSSMTTRWSPARAAALKCIGNGVLHYIDAYTTTVTAATCGNGRAC
ncbi:MAG TPA: hypothetical protein VET24_06085 [Actinomycetota bacterium]|nr:hypothetical protein [Actinomycetota bacterium]